jgi:hypothetical protein
MDNDGIKNLNIILKVLFILCRDYSLDGRALILGTSGNLYENLKFTLEFDMKNEYSSQNTSQMSL